MFPRSGAPHDRALHGRARRGYSRRVAPASPDERAHVTAGASGGGGGPERVGSGPDGTISVWIVDDDRLHRLVVPFPIDTDLVLAWLRRLLPPGGRSTPEDAAHAPS